MGNRRTYIAAFLLPTVAVLIGLAVGGFAPFGGGDIMTACGAEEPLIYLLEFKCRLRDGTVTGYSYRVGSGYDFSTVITYILSDPLNLVALIFPEAAMTAVLDIMYALRLGMAGLCFAIYLKRSSVYRAAGTADRVSGTVNVAAEKVDTVGGALDARDDEYVIGRRLEGTAIGRRLSGMDMVTVALAAMYALSTHMIVYGANISYISAMAVFPILMLYVDRLIRDGKWRGYSVALAVSILLSFQLSVVSSIFVLIYFLAGDYGDFRTLLKRLKSKVLADILAVGMAAIVILNNLGSSFVAESMDTDFNMSGFITSAVDMVKQLWTGMYPSVRDDYSKGIDLYCGAATVLLVVMYMLNRRIGISRRLKTAAVIVLLLAGNYVYTANQLLDGFYYSTDNYSLFNYALVFMLLITARAKIEIVSGVKSVAIAEILLIVMVIGSGFLCVFYNNFFPYAVTLILSVVYFLICLIYSGRSMTALIYRLSLATVMLIEICTMAVVSIGRLGTFAESFEETDTYRLYKAESYIHESDDTARILVYTNYKTDSTPLTDMLLGYDYVITPYMPEYPGDLIYVDERDGIYIYENPYSLDTVYLSDAIETWDGAENYPYTAQNQLVEKCFDGETIFDITGVELVSDEIMKLSEETGYIKSDNYRTYIYYRFSLTPGESGDLYMNMAHVLHVGEVEAGETVDILYAADRDDFTMSVTTGEFALYRHDALARLYDKLVSTDSGDYMLLNVTSPQNWSMGDETAESIDIIGNSVSLIKVTDGETLTYSCRNLKTGALVSLIFVVIFAVVSVIGRVKMSMGKVSEYLNDNRVYIYTMFITTVLYFVLVLINGCEPFGEGSVVSSDGYFQSYFSHSYMFGLLREGSYPDINFRNGMATPVLFESRLINPLCWLMVPVPIEHSLLMYNFIYYIRLLLVGCAMLYYLTHRYTGKRLDKHSLRLVPIALAYNLCSYVITYYNYNDYLTFAVMVPVMTLALERLVYDRKPAAYILILAWYMMYESFVAFLLCEYLVLYFLVLKFDGIRDFVRSGVRFVLSSILSAGLVGAYLLTYYLYLQSTSYASSDSSTGILDRLSLDSALLSNVKYAELFHITEIVSDDWTRANIYAGTFVLMAIVLYVMNTRIDLRSRVKRSVLIALYYLAFGNSFLNYVLHGFHTQSKAPNRFAVFFVFLMVTALYDCVIEYKAAFTRSRVVALGLWSLLLVSLMLYETLTTNPIGCIVSVALIVVYYGIWFIGYMRKHYYGTVRVLLFLMTAELMVGFVYDGLTSTGVSSASDIIAANFDKIRSFSEEYSLSDEQMRTEVYNDTYANAALVGDFSSVSTFTTITSQQKTLVDSWGVYNSGNTISYMGGNPLAAMFMNVGYIIDDSIESGRIPEYMEYTDGKGNFSLYKNPYRLSLGILLTEETDFSDINKEDYPAAVDYQNEISRRLVGKDLYNVLARGDEGDNYIHVEYSPYSSSKVSVVTEFSVSLDGEAEIYLNHADIIVYSGTKSEDDEDFTVAGAGFYASTEDAYRDDNYLVASLNEDVAEEIYELLRGSVMESVETVDSTVNGTVSGSGTLFVSLPNYDGWHAYVDGEEVEILDYLGGIGIEISGDGEHAIMLSYEKPVYAAGIIISIVSWVVFVGYAASLIHRRKKDG